MEASPLGRLPAELRNEIYWLVLEAQDPIQIYCVNKDFFQARRVPLAITATCRAIRSESLGIFYASNTFELHPELRADPEAVEVVDLCAWVRAIGIKNFKLAKSVTIDVGEVHEFEDDSDIRPFRKAWVKAVRRSEALTLIRQCRIQLRATVYANGFRSNTQSIRLRFSLCWTRDLTERSWANAELIEDPPYHPNIGRLTNVVLQNKVRWAVEKIREVVLHQRMW